MALLFTQEKNKKNFLIIILAIVIVVAGFIFWEIFLKQGVINVYEPVVLQPKQVNIDFRAFETIEQFRPFIEIERLEDEAGRENPFLPY